MKSPVYFNGPGGIFYNAKWNEIFQLQDTGEDIICIEKKKVVFKGKIYNRIGRTGTIKRIRVIGMETSIRLGDL